MATRKALIIGATGLVGGFCLQALLDEPKYSEVTVLVRKPLRKTHPQLKEIVTNFNNLDDVLSAIHVDDVYCCLGTTIKKAGSREAFRKIDFTLVVTIAGLMKGQGATQFLVISAMGANKDAKIFYNRIKGEMEEALKDQCYSCLRIIRPSLLLGPREEFRLGEKIAVLFTPFLNPFMLGPLKKYKPVEAKAVAQFMVNVAGEESVRGIQVYESNMIV